MTTSHLSPRTRNGCNPDHHMWNNNGTWWCHFTVHHADHTKERVRFPLHTRNREEARLRRDLLLRAVPSIVAALPPAAAARGGSASPSGSLINH